MDVYDGDFVLFFIVIDSNKFFEVFYEFIFGVYGMYF